MNKLLSKNYFLIIVIFCIAVLTVCYLYGAHTGLNSQITGGFELDATSISIALSRLWFNLHEGYIGYRSVFYALYHVLVPDGNSNNSVNFPLLGNPQSIQAAFNYAKNIIPGSLIPYSVLSNEFVNIGMEDIGLSDFYTIAFMVFGVKPTAMYNLYFLLFGISTAVFLIEYRKQAFPLLLIAIIVGTFPIFFFSNFFNISIPSVNGNRFISTFGFIPIAYILCLYFSPNIALNRWQIARILFQALLFSFALSIRRSSQWQLLALSIFVLPIFIKIFIHHRKSWFALENVYLLKKPILAGFLIFVTTVSAYKMIQEKSLNPVYSTDCSPSGHAIWHSAYMGLTLHPKWEQLNQLQLPNNIGDATGWKTFEKYMHDRGLDPVCHISNGYNLRLHEIVMKQEFFGFINRHQQYAFELYTYYKPKLLFKLLWLRIAKTPLFILGYILLLDIFLGYMLAIKLALSQTINIRMTVLATTLFLVCSWIPLLFAYPILYTPDDFWMLIIWASVIVSLNSFYYARKRHIMSGKGY